MTHSLKKAALPFLVSFAVFVGIFIGFHLQSPQPGTRFFKIENRSPLQEILSLIDKRYVDGIDTKNMADSAIQAIINQLDPHSAYIPAIDLQAVNNDIKGSFYGIGIGYNMIEDTLHVISLLDESPARRDGVLIGDKILKAGDSLLSNKKRKSGEILTILTGEKSSSVILTILRNDKLVKIPVQRDEIKISSVDAHFMLEPGVGYIRLNRFSTKTYKEFMQALMSLKDKKMTKLILDLRDNGGGVLEEAVEIADEFLTGDKLIAYTEGKHSSRKEYRCRREGQFETGELVVLSNEGSASASEILMGALQDWDRATIVGKTSFGKGLVQEQYNLSDGSALRLTISRYYTPLGRSLQRSYAAGKTAYYENIYQTETTDSTKKIPGKIFTTAAGNKLSEHVGIMPDVFVKSDSSLLTPALLSMYRKGLFRDFGYLHSIANPGLTNKYRSPTLFNDSFQLDSNGWILVNRLVLKDTTIKKVLAETDKQLLAPLLKNALANQLYPRSGYFEIISKKDPAVAKALEILK